MPGSDQCVATAPQSSHKPPEASVTLAPYPNRTNVSSSDQEIGATLRSAPSFHASAIQCEKCGLAVYNTTADHTVIQVSIFARGASGNVAPSRVISGPLTGIGAPGYAGAGKISVSADGRLFVAESGGRILVFAAGASGNTAPAQIITDPALGSAGQGGIAVRSCLCQ